MGRPASDAHLGARAHRHAQRVGQANCRGTKTPRNNSRRPGSAKLRQDRRGAQNWRGPDARQAPRAQDRPMHAPPSPPERLPRRSFPRSAGPAVGQTIRQAGRWPGRAEPQRVRVLRQPSMRAHPRMPPSPQPKRRRQTHSRPGARARAERRPYAQPPEAVSEAPVSEVPSLLVSTCTSPDNWPPSSISMRP